MQVSIQEFKSHLSHYVNQAQLGSPIELTSHRTIVARIVGVPASAVNGMAALLARGGATWSGGKPKGASLSLSQPDKLLSTMVLEDRG